jgi:ubiquitin-activating enzyme E1
MCTIKSFPYLIEHCIEWSRDVFNRIFVDTPNNTALYIEKPESFVAEQQKDTTVDGVKEQLENIKNLVEFKKTADFNITVQIARDYFEEFFNHQILNLVSLFPKDYKD